MSYEVYIDVRHHPRHLDDFEEQITDCGKFAEPSGATPSEAEKLRTVVGALRGMADKYDPDWHCTHCNKVRSEHFGYPQRLTHCFNRYGPVTQWSWWRENQADETAAHLVP